MRYEHTEIFNLASLRDTIRVCTRLIDLKRMAPWSLRFIVAVTAIRDVEFRGSTGRPPHIGDSLRAMSQELDGTPLPVAEPAPAGSKRTRRVRRRTLDPQGY